MIKRLLIIYIILTSLELYNIAALGESIVKMAQMTGIGLLLLIILLQSVYNREAGFKLNFKWEITAIFISLLLSVLMAYSGHGQSFSITIIAQRFMYFYLFYFALHQIRIPETDLENIMIYLAVAHGIFYIIQFFAYPTILFNVRVSSDRGTIRIFLQGLTYLILAYFYILHRLYENFRLSRLLLLLFLFSIFILMGTRQLIFTMFMLTMINVLLSNKVKSKLLIFTLVILATIPVFFMFQNIFLNMLMVSETQSAGFEEDIRIRSATYFLTDFFPNRLAYITGNGVDSANSGFGMMIQMYKDVYGYFQTDIGIIGDFSRYGVFFLIAVLSIIIRVLSSKIPEHLSYIKYLFITILLTFFTGGGAFGQGGSIVAICTTLYMIDVHRHDVSIDDETGEDDEEDEPETTKETVEMIHN
jgi:hypothetical protein